MLHYEICVYLFTRTIYDIFVQTPQHSYIDSISFDIIASTGLCRFCYNMDEAAIAQLQDWEAHVFHRLCLVCRS